MGYNVSTGPADHILAISFTIANRFSCEVEKEAKISTAYKVKSSTCLA